MLPGRRTLLKPIAVLIPLLFLTIMSRAEIHRSARIVVGPKQPRWSLLDLSGKFSQQALALTKSGDFLVLSSHRSGTWELTRVREWNSTKPVIEHLELPDYFSSKDDHDLETLELRLMLTPDERYAACTADAWWNKRVNGKSVGKSRSEIRISSIDLEEFRVVGRDTTAALSLFEFQDVFMRSDGQLVVRSSSPQLKEGAFVPIDMPGLGVGPKCMYRNEIGPDHQLHPIPTTGEPCLQSTRNLSLENYLTDAGAQSRVGDKFACTSRDLDYCPEPDRFSSDGRVAMGIMTEGHDSFLGPWVQTKAIAVFYSTKTHSQIDARDVSHSDAYMELASANGKEYLLTLEDGSVLTVYEIDLTAP